MGGKFQGKPPEITQYRLLDIEMFEKQDVVFK